MNAPHAPLTCERWLTPVLPLICQGRGRLWLGGLMLAGLTACAQVQVVSVSPDMQHPAYELHGATVSHLQTEARRLCPQGFDVLRWAEADTRQPGDFRVVQWWNQALSWVSDDDRQAQMAVVCRISALKTSN